MTSTWQPVSGKCLHCYFYFMDRELGLVYLRVPTWAPFHLQFYCNGHGWLARRLAANGIGFTAADNAFVRIDDWPRCNGGEFPSLAPLEWSHCIQMCQIPCADLESTTALSCRPESRGVTSALQRRTSRQPRGPCLIAR